MKKLFFAGMVVALAGCVQVDRYEDVVKARRRLALQVLANERAAERDDES